MFQALDLLPRTSFLGSVLLVAHGAEHTIKVLADQVEELNFTLLPDSIGRVPLAPSRGPDRAANAR